MSGDSEKRQLEGTSKPSWWSKYRGCLSGLMVTIVVGLIVAVGILWFESTHGLTDAQEWRELIETMCAIGSVIGLSFVIAQLDNAESPACFGGTTNGGRHTLKEHVDALPLRCRAHRNAVRYFKRSLQWLVAFRVCQALVPLFARASHVMVDARGGFWPVWMAVDSALSMIHAIWLFLCGFAVRQMLRKQVYEMDDTKTPLSDQHVALFFSGVLALLAQIKDSQFLLRLQMLEMAVVCVGLIMLGHGLFRWGRSREATICGRMAASGRGDRFLAVVAFAVWGVMQVGYWPSREKVNLFVFGLYHGALIGVGIVASYFGARLLAGEDKKEDSIEHPWVEQKSCDAELESSVCLCRPLRCLSALNSGGRSIGLYVVGALLSIFATLLWRPTQDPWAIWKDAVDGGDKCKPESHCTIEYQWRLSSLFGWRCGAKPVALADPDAAAGCGLTEAPPRRRFDHLPITKELVKSVEDKPELRRLLEQSIELAKWVNPDPMTNPAQTLEAYYDFIDRAAIALPWSILDWPVDGGLFDRIDQSLNYFYFINDQPLGELEGRGYYRNSLQYHEPYRTWLLAMVKQWGECLSKPDSWNHKYLGFALADPKFGLQNGWYEGESNWRTFNEFFARHLQNDGQRPIQEIDNPYVVTSPADARPEGVWKIGQDSHVVGERGVAIKSATVSSIETLIGPESAYGTAFAGGTLTHTFLDVQDYHRYHFPVAGTVKELRVIPGDNAVGGTITWDHKEKRYRISSSQVGWQYIEARGRVIVQTEKLGLVAVLPVGMSQVSSVNFEDSVRVGSAFKKGAPLGYFLFGGSDIVMLFQKGEDFELAVSKGSDGFPHLLMGEVYGRVRAPD